ncbi:hypothetical protein [Rhodococcoides yunnanense]|uniref:hypothetical protein n=1 Tax=Rhodococcoides yunnanense TaxID=278209 RepID=UPI000933BFF5|nr:hypothetical protein [Rhodococcus yunnanensis]
MTDNVEVQDPVIGDQASTFRPLALLHTAIGSGWIDGLDAAKRLMSNGALRIVVIDVGSDEDTFRSELSDDLVGSLETLDVHTASVEFVNGAGGTGIVLDRVAQLFSEDTADLVIVRSLSAKSAGSVVVLLFANERRLRIDPPVRIDGYASLPVAEDLPTAGGTTLRTSMQCAEILDSGALEHLRIAGDEDVPGLVLAAVDAHAGTGAPAASCVLGLAAGVGLEALGELAFDMYSARIPATPDSIGQIAESVGIAGSPLCITAADQPWLRRSRGGRRHAALLGTFGSDVEAIVVSGVGTVADHTPIDWVGRSAPAIIVLTGTDGPDLAAAAGRVRSVLERGADLYRVSASMASVTAANACADESLRAVMVASDASTMIQELRAAERDLPEAVAARRPWATPSGSCCDPALAAAGGRVAFVYPGTYASYPGAESGLFELFPALLTGVEVFSERPAETFGMERQYLRGHRIPTSAEVADHDREIRSDIGFMSSSAVHYAMLGTTLMRDFLEVHADGVLGYSLGEMCMLFSTDLWSLRDGTGLGVQRSAIFRSELYGPRTVVRQAWGLPDDTPDDEVWTTLAVAAPIGDVRVIAAHYDRVFITHVNTDGEVLIAGDPLQCASVVEGLGCGSFALPGGGPVLHVPLVEAANDSVADLTDHRLGRRDESLEYLFAVTEETPDLTSTSAVAEVISALCRTEVDFPALCRRAHTQGYRYFIEIGPGSDCTRWIDTNLDGLPHVAVSLDRRGSSQSRSIARALATLIAGGLDVPLGRLFPPALVDNDLIRELQGAVRDVAGVDPIYDEAITVDRRSTTVVAAARAFVPASPESAPPEPSRRGFTHSDAGWLLSDRIAVIAQDVARAHIAALEAQSALQGAALARLEGCAPMAGRHAESTTPDTTANAVATVDDVQPITLRPIPPRTRSLRVERRRGFKPLEFTDLRALSPQAVVGLAAGDLVAVFGERWAQQNPDANPEIRIAAGRPLISRVPVLDPSGGEFRLGSIVAEHLREQPQQRRGSSNTTDSDAAELTEASAQVLRAYAIYLGLHLVFPDAEFRPAPDVATVFAAARRLTPEDYELRYEVEVTDIAMTPRPTVVANVHVLARDELVATVEDLAVEIRERAGTLFRPEITEDGSPVPVNRWGRSGELVFLNEFHMAHLEDGQVDIALGVEVAQYKGKTELYIPNGEFRLVDRVLSIAGDRERLRTGRMVSEYDAATQSWYYEDNSFDGMPASVIMESSLQSAALTGACLGVTLHVPPDQRLSVRNLDGTATILADLDVRGMVLRQESTLLSTTVVAGQILQRYEYEMTADGVPFYAGESLFGYFTADALASDMGLDGGRSEPYWIETDAASEFRDSVVDVDFSHDASWFDPSAHNGLRIGSGHFRLVDTAQIVIGGGRHGKGYLRGARAVEPDDWYFDCHFHKDPVMPGTLGVEAVTQGLQSYVIAAGLAESSGPVRFGIAAGVPFGWTYRGQILRNDAEMGFELDVTDIRRTERGLVVTADASVFKPGVRIYHFTNLAVEVVREGCEG